MSSPLFINKIEPSWLPNGTIITSYKLILLCKMFALLWDFFDSTTVHGFAYVHKRNHGLFRILWVNFQLLFRIISSTNIMATYLGVIILSIVGSFAKLRKRQTFSIEPFSSKSCLKNLAVSMLTPIAAKTIAKLSSWSSKTDLPGRRT